MATRTTLVTSRLPVPERKLARTGSVSTGSTVVFLFTEARTILVATEVKRIGDGSWQLSSEVQIKQNQELNLMIIGQD
jgi:hypothetical protein